MNQKFNTDFYALGICKFKNKYLILKIADDREWCPGDWDFVPVHNRYYPKKGAEKFLIEGIYDYTGLKGNIIRKGRVFVFPDRESQMNWIIWPCIIDIKSSDVKLNRKYTAYQWVLYKDITKFDRQNYLTTCLKHVVY